MDWPLTIRRNREQLKAIVLALFALARMRAGGALLVLPRSTFAIIMLILRPAESAVRRLILLAAHGIETPAAAQKAAKPGGPPDFPLCREDVRQGGYGYASRKAFKLFDPLKSFDPEAWDAGPVWESGFGLAASGPLFTAADQSPLDATRLGQRLNAILSALDTLPAQARRLVRWQQKRDALLKARKPTRLSPMRPGLPPGWRQRRLHEVDDVLKECHGLATGRMNEPDTG